MSQTETESSNQVVNRALVSLRDPELVRRLYCIEGKSLKQIASIAGTTKSDVHYWMVKHGITRRECSAKRPKCNPNTLCELYWKECKSIRETAKLVGVTYSTVRKYLLRQGQPSDSSITEFSQSFGFNRETANRDALHLRRRGGRIKYQRTPFSDDERERAYLLGLRGGDLNAARTSPNSVMARVSTTHPAMLELFQRTFSKYGHCRVVPRRVFLTGYDWQTRVYLDNTFSFLVRKPDSVPEDQESFYSFLAGLSDSDGCWSIGNGKGKSKYAFKIESEESELLREVRIRLESLGFHPTLYLSRRKGTTKILNGVVGKMQITLTMDLWGLRLQRWKEVLTVAAEIVQLSRHREKVEKMKIMLETKNREWTAVELRVKNLRSEIRNEVKISVKTAEIEYKARHADVLC